MRLSKLKLAGFKTFVDPTTVLTPGRLVGVVGPNGCGKSNIIDAVRWVLGESRASALRGESMQDVIFNGSTTRKPVARASVELVFDNAEGRASGQWRQYAEISVKRVLDRSGESTYFINQAPVRRKDVIDLFLGTGLGPRAYAIIEQGMISRIIEARPEEIRGFLEEAAGVTKYRERRRETEGRLGDARDNLLRLDDIRGELAGRIEHLAVQAEVAERHQALTAALAEQQQLLWLLKCLEARRQRAAASSALADGTRRIDADNARIQALESEIEICRETHFATSEAVHQAQSDLFAVTAEVSRLEAERRHLQDARQRLERRLDELEADRHEWEARVANLAAEQERWQGLAEHAARRVAIAEARHEAARDRLPEAEEALRVAEAASQALRRDLAQTEQAHRVEETKRASALRALDALAQRRTRLEAEGSAIVVPAGDGLAEREAALELQRQQIEEGQAKLAALQVALPEAQAALKVALEAERADQRRVAEIRARRDALAQLQTKVQRQGALGDWLAEHGWGNLEPLWKGLRVAPGWEMAVEAVLRERLSALAPQDIDMLLAALDAPPPGTLAFCLPTAPARADLVARDLPGVPLSNHCTWGASPFAAAVHNWLAGVRVVDELGPWLAGAGGLPPEVALVTQRGQILTRGLLTHYAPDARTHGVMEREREIEVLAGELALAQEVAVAAHRIVQDGEERVQHLQESSGVLRREIQTRQQDMHSEQVALLKLQQARSRALERAAQLEADLTEHFRAEEAEVAHLGQAEIELARCAEMADLQRLRLESALESQREREGALRESRSLDQAMTRELQEAQFSERECAGKLDDGTRNRTLADEQLARNAREVAQREAELAATTTGSNEAALQAALDQREERERALAGRRDALAAAAATLREREELRLQTEQAAAPVRERVAQLRLDVQAAELAEGQFAARLAESGADEVSLAPRLTGELREIALQREVSRLGRELAELGAVNLAAVDELRAARERKGYLDDQFEDLTTAIATLEDAIRRIDRETREQLAETYNTVTRHFSTLFPQLFGGGEARLVLTGEEILDAGIQIVAQPPGKKNSSIHLLSGGEKALTAIALVFAMFQLNPAPFCMLDEVDAPLDDTNTERFCEMVRRMSVQTQFLFISHSKITMEIAQQLIGVTMQEQGASRVVEVDIEEALKLAEAVSA
ncbi:MAG: chromosome segregation protein SMC [Zoogloeaceae bacterium]|nr:chromosome segregation protein SMC [Zoogloeaceae bacterium]